MSLTQIAVIMLIALILFGPEDLPVFARALGKMVAKVRKLIKEISSEFQDVIDTPTNIVNDVLKEPNKGKTAKQETSPRELPEEEQNNKDQEELLTYEDNISTDDTKEASSKRIGTNPLSDLPPDIVTYSKDKQAGE